MTVPPPLCQTALPFFDAAALRIYSHGVKYESRPAMKVKVRTG
jgi:hypothetical protein